MTTQRLRIIMPLAILLLSAASFFFLLTAPQLPAWGYRNTPHEGNKTLPLPSGHVVEQSFLAEYSVIDKVAVWPALVTYALILFITLDLSIMLYAVLTPSLAVRKVKFPASARQPRHRYILGA